MKDQGFLRMVKRKGEYVSTGEASRAANAVFGTIKSWISPAASEQIRKMLPLDAARIWQYSPVSFWSDLSPMWKDMEFQHMVLKVQQLGCYELSADAQRAYGSVLGALKELFPGGTEIIIGKSMPVEVPSVAVGDRLKAVAT